MKIELEIPDPKYKIGDEVTIANERNDRFIHVRIHNVTIEGG